MKTNSLMQSNKKFAVVVATAMIGTLAFSPSVSALKPDEVVVTSPNTQSVDYWCGENPVGVTFDTGAVGTHTSGPISIKIIAGTPTEVASVSTSNPTIVATKVIVKGGATGGDGYGNNVYLLPTTNSMIAPPSSDQVRFTDVSHVIVCYKTNRTTTTDVNTDVLNDTVVVDDTTVVADDTNEQDQPEVLSAVTDNDDSTNGQVQGAQTLAETGLPAWAVVLTGTAVVMVVAALKQPESFEIKKDI